MEAARPAIPLKEWRRRGRPWRPQRPWLGGCGGPGPQEKIWWPRPRPWRWWRPARRPHQTWPPMVAMPGREESRPWGPLQECAMDNLGVKKVEAPSKCPEKWLIKWFSHQKKNYIPQFLKQRDINSYYLPSRLYTLLLNFIQAKKLDNDMSPF